MFLDADDILAPSFLESRVSTLEQNRSVGFCCSYVIKIDEHGNHLPSRRLKGVTTEIMKDVLSYDSEVITCPSNYLFRRSILDANSLRFNTELSSSADRYFLIETAMYSTGELINESAYLYYRVHKESMSNKFTSHLLQDNLLFQKKILEMNNIPKDLKKEFCYKTNYIFAGSYFKLREFMPCLWFTVKAFYFNPPKFVSQLINRK